jgi:uncharacterized protein YndB with AHSA1/START domain
MATSRVTPDAGAVESEVQIAAPAERVFEALVDPAQVPQWRGSRESTGAPNFTPICEPEENGGRWEWAATGGRSR